jgi:hypothetical protein
MKYFTPELIARNQVDDNAIQNEVEAIWDLRIEEYDRYLAGVKHLFTPGLKLVADGYYLHDADVHAIGRSGDQLVFVLQFDTVQRTLLVLRYQLVEEPRIDHDALPEVARIGGGPMWQYDEVELVEGDPPTWRQSILLSNGWEVTLHFRDVLVEEIEAILPAPRQSSFSAPADLPQTA